MKLVEVEELPLFDISEQVKQMMAVPNAAGVFWCIVNKDGDLLYNRSGVMNKDIIWLLERVKWKLFKELDEDG